MLIQDLKAQPQHLPTLAAWHHHEWWSLNPGSSVEQRIEDMQAYLSADFIPEYLYCHTIRANGLRSHCDA